jgi:hypothetical protein
LREIGIDKHPRETPKSHSDLMTTGKHSYHGYDLVLRRDSDDRYQVTIFDSNSDLVVSTGMHLERHGALAEAWRYVDHFLAARRP